MFYQISSQLNITLTNVFVSEHLSTTAVVRSVFLSCYGIAFVERKKLMPYFLGLLIEVANLCLQHAN